MRAHQDSTPSRPTTLIGEIDPRVERIILQCLERDPAARPRTALDVARALPGGDPLAAALAAGETPSPEMVAASGGVGSLPVRKARVMLAGAMLLLVACVALAPWSTELGLAPLENSPDVMIHRAQDLAHKFGYKDPPWDTTFWFERNYFFLVERARKLAPSENSATSSRASRDTPCSSIARARETCSVGARNGRLARNGTCRTTPRRSR
jgi:hypothetical protein